MIERGLQKSKKKDRRCGWHGSNLVREVINEKSHRNSTDDIFPKKKRTFLNVKGGVPPTLNGRKSEDKKIANTVIFAQKNYLLQS